MRVWRSCSSPGGPRGVVVAIGNFDGVHRGHRAVLGAAREHAAARGVPLAAMTFEPHPRSVFDPKAAPMRLTPLRTKARLMDEMGVDALVVLRFDSSLASQSAEAFAAERLARGLAVRHVVVGHDFVFGKGRRGTPSLLTELGQELGFGVTVTAAARDDEGQPFSSTRIRALLREGDPPAAAVLLGRPWEIEGRVRRGDARGRALGFPTANLSLGSLLRPRAGVYAVRCILAAGRPSVPGVANIGVRPTVGGAEERLEVHLFDWSGDLYGRCIRVALLDFLRPERRFDDLAALRAQIAEDCEVARLRLGLRGQPVSAVDAG